MDQLKQTQVCYPVPARLRGDSQKQQNTPTTSLAQLNAAHPTLLHMRDGEVVLYRRSNSPTWQTRYKLKDGSWCRASTRKMSVEHAVQVACTLNSTLPSTFPVIGDPRLNEINGLRWFLC